MLFCRENTLEAPATRSRWWQFGEYMRFHALSREIHAMVPTRGVEVCSIFDRQKASVKFAKSES
jgi:hypothetical protein